MKSIFTPEDRRELYNGVTNPREELLGDTLELALGILTMAIRYPNHFINWGGSDGANADACVRVSKDRSGVTRTSRTTSGRTGCQIRGCGGRRQGNSVWTSYWRSVDCAAYAGRDDSG